MYCAGLPGTGQVSLDGWNVHLVMPPSVIALSTL